METLFQDIRYGVRTLLKSPGFTAVAIVSLALGIGANASIFSVINAVMWRPLPYKDADRVMAVQRTDPRMPGEILPWSYPKFELLRAGSESFEEVAAVTEQNFPLTETEEPERLKVEMVSVSYFPLLGVEAAVGRTFAPEEGQTPNANPVAIIGHGLWQRRFGSDPNVIGQTISLNKVSLTIIGVLPEGFKGQAGAVEAWAPIMMAPALMNMPRRLVAPFAHWHDVIARLKPGVTVAQAQAEMELVGQKIEAALQPSAGAGAADPEAVKVVSLKESRVDPAIHKSFLILFAAVGFVLLIACANIASLLMARSASRRKEIAIRLALGASRARLIRQLLTESVLLALAGGAAALVVALWGIEFLTAVEPASLPTWANHARQLDFSAARIDGQVLAFNFLLSVITGLLFGLMPAFKASRSSVSEAIKEGSRRSIEAPMRLGRLSMRNLLVTVEIALALVLLIGAGLMIRSFVRLQDIKTGFNPDHLLTFQVQLARYKDAAAASFYEQLLGRVNALPGVQSASVASSTPLSSNSSATIMKIQGQQEMAGAVGIHSVAPDHFKTLGIPLLKGRSFTEQDRSGAARVAIISEAAARQFWPDEDPVGKRIWLAVGWEQNEYGEIVGVVGDVKYHTIEEAVRPDFYLSYLQPTESSSFVIVRAEGDPARLISAIRREVISLDRNVPLYDIKTMRERGAEATSRTRFSALLLVIFAGLALVLSAVGVYGVMAYAVSGRTQEIGIRMALGARPRDVFKLILAEGLVLTLIGLAFGLAAAYWATRVLASQLYEVGATDPFTFAIVSLLLTLVALAACYAPARRATQVDPMVALRYE